MSEYLFDILLLSVAVWTGYLAVVVLARFGAGQRAYGMMILGDLVLAIVALAARRADASPTIANLVGTVAIGGGICLVVLPPILRNLSRRAVAADYMRVARMLVELRELLAPGMGARQEGELIETILAVRAGQVDGAIEMLRARRADADDAATRRHIDERITMTFLYARRWSDAIGEFESTFDREPGPMSPQLLVEMVRAYCEVGDLSRAAELVARIELAGGPDEPVLAFLINRARLVFLAFVGRTSAVEAIVAPGGPLGAMPASARCFWSGVARLNAGDRTGARASLSEAARLSGRDGRARQLAETTLLSIDRPGVAGPHQVPPIAAELADRLTELAAAPRSTARAQVPIKLSGVSWRQVPVTIGFLVANLAAAAALYLVSESAGDLGTLVLAGANAKSATAGGDWWRLVTSMFLHVGAPHLLLNMYGLWVLGRLVEQFHGSVRLFAIYVISGVAGALASVVFGGPATSMGASGAVFGLLGAAIVELAIHRRRYPRQWSGLLLGNLVFLTLANVAIGFLYPIIDQSAHIGGLIAGAALSLVLSRKLAIAMTLPVRLLAGVLALASATAIVYGAWGLVRHDYGDALRQGPRVRRTIGGLAIEVPKAWQQMSDYQVYDPNVATVLALERTRPEGGAVGLDDAIDELLRAEHFGGAKRAGFESAADAERPLLRLPAGWVVRELTVRAHGVGGEQRFRASIFGRQTVDGELWLGSLYYPEALADSLAPLIAEVLGSAQPASAAAR